MTETLLAARTRYYQVNGFGTDGGHSLDWVPLKIWKFTIKIPNTDGRRKAVRIHDLHHVLTGYPTTLAGESEIAAWELATGCLQSTAATVLNTAGLAAGVVIAPRRVARAWARGRKTTNLYREPGVEHLLPRTVEDMRAALRLDQPPASVRVRDVLAMLAVALPALAVLTALTLAPFVGLAALVRALV